MRRKFAWSTDIHLDVLELQRNAAAVVEFAKRLSESSPDFIVISGDISIASELPRHLDILEEHSQVPIYFVCGNHDFYGGEIQTVRDIIKVRCEASRKLNYLTQANVIKISDETALIGHDGWYDAHFGEPKTSNIVMNDWLQINDFVNAGAAFRGAKIRSTVGSFANIPIVTSLSRRFAHAAAEHIKKMADLAAKSYKSVIIVTHVPPWLAAHDPRNPKSNPASLPWYTSKMMGDAIEEVAARNRHVKFNVLCGHTHGRVSVPITTNVMCHVGMADYGRPQVNIVEFV
jgi:predicted MPP superfamily phosphohydrolase